MTTQRWTRATIVALAATLLAAHLVAGSAFGAFTARIDNANTATTPSMKYTHVYGSTCSSSTSITDTQTVACPGSLYPSSVTGSPGPDMITAYGTASSTAVGESVTAPSCGAVQLANRKNTSNPMVARYGTNFAVTASDLMGGTGGAVTLDGATPGGYETSVVQQTQPNPGLSLGSLYGLGIWFKTTSNLGGPLFGFGDSPSNVAGSNDRVLFMNPNGTLGFTQNLGGATTSVTNSTPWNDGSWHLAYVTMSVTSILVGVLSTVTVSVDGTQVASGGGLFVGLSSYNGYWHVGWSPVRSGANPRQYFTGSLSNFVVFNGANAPSTLPRSASQSAFDTATANATEHWRFNDSGTSTLPATITTLPGISTASPCSFVDITWGFSSPASCLTVPQSTTVGCTGPTQLSAFVSGTPKPVATVSAMQTSTITFAKNASYGTSANTFLPGVRIYAPLTISFRYASTGWRLDFMWTGVASEFVL